VTEPRGRVLAIGLDAAEPSLLTSMLADGELPALQELLAAGSWSRVESPAGYGSGAVWPTFFTGTDPVDHGQYSHWSWDPGAMALSYYDGSRHTPFWRALQEDGLTIGVLDVPFAPLLGVDRGFEVLEWGAHDWVDGRPSMSPAAVAEAVGRDHAKHPFSNPLAAPPEDPAGLSRHAEECLEGTRLRGDVAVRLLTEHRPDVAVVVFPEVHHAGHFLWHTVEPHLPMYDDLRHDPPPAHDLRELHRELDRQVGRLVEAVTDPARPQDLTVIVFGLHGMAGSRGVPDVLEPLLAGMGLSHLDNSVSRRQALLSAVKKRLPTALRDLYRSTVPLSTRSQWGKASLLPAYDWARTRAFVLPTDQFGWVRVNLRGREARGTVPPEEYVALLDRIEDAVRALRTTAGRPVAADVIRPPRTSGPDPLPDLIVHWTPEAFEAPVPVHGVETVPVRRAETGQHALDGFCVVRGSALAGTVADVVQVKDLHELVLRAAAAGDVA
jgi:predicted AlkP superfamily phosphohydrolase/phosphomutase